MTPMSAVPEDRRLAALASYNLFGTLAEPAYDRFTELGARLFETPICLVSLIGEDEQWLKAHYGLDLCSTSREVSICARTLTQDAPLVILDLALDPRFRNNPLVIGSPRIRFYAGAPLINAAGVRLGAFCVIDTKPRERFSDEEQRLLSNLASMVMSKMERRRTSRPNKKVDVTRGVKATAVVTADANGSICFWNKAAQAMFGHPVQEAIGRSLDLIFPDRFREERLAGWKEMIAGGAAKLVGKSMEAIAVRRNGTEFLIEMTMTMVTWRGGTGQEFGVQIRDITARRERELRLQHLAHHDPLTGLMNRAGFLDHLEGCLSEGNAATLLAFDLDGFKSVNDNFGHPVGDALLQGIALRLKPLAESSSNFARIGGDEFALVLAGEADPLAATRIAGNLLGTIHEPFHIAGHTLQVGVSIGIAMAPLHATMVDVLMQRADLALLAAKKDGGRRICFFHTGLSNEFEARRAFKKELRQATEQKQWELFYQPQVRLDGRSLLGVEALLRWRHPQRGLLTPAAFLSVLETHPVAYEVGTWVIDEACRQLASWRHAGWKVPRMSVNVFAAQFASGTLDQVVRAALDRHALRPGDLEIEVTETIAFRPDDQTPTTLRALRDAGVHLAFDDFGTGFASLTSLKQLPVSRLKIDRSFVEDICNAPHSAAIVTAIVSLADRLDLEVIAEGIETEEQRTMLISLGCWAGQGYLLGLPVSAQELPRWYAVAA